MLEIGQALKIKYLHSSHLFMSYVNNQYDEADHGGSHL